MDFYRDFFTREQLLVSLEQAQFIPGMMAPLFETLSNVTSTNVDIEILGKDAVTPADSKPRGAAADQLTLDKDGVEPFKTKFYSKEIPILADSVLNARQRGGLNPEVIMGRRDRAVRKLRNWVDIQHEFLRISAVNTPSNVFGNAPAEVVVGFGAADTVAVKAAIFSNIIEPIETALDGLTYTGIDAYCSKDYWLGLIQSKTMRETYLYAANEANLRGIELNSFTYDNVTWHRYRPQGTLKITDGKAKEAAAVMREIRMAERQIARAEADAAADVRITRTMEKQKFDTVVARVEADYPEFNPDSESYDSDLVELVLTKQNSLIRSQGLSPSIAMDMAAKDVAARFLTKAEAKADEVKGLAKANAAEDRKQEQVKKNLDTQKRQPASLKESGIDSDKLGKTSEMDMSTMTADEINALPEATRARLRGDYV